MKKRVASCTTVHVFYGILLIRFHTVFESALTPHIISGKEWFLKTSPEYADFVRPRGTWHLNAPRIRTRRKTSSLKALLLHNNSPLPRARNMWTFRPLLHRHCLIQLKGTRMHRPRQPRSINLLQRATLLRLRICKRTLLSCLRICERTLLSWRQLQSIPPLQIELKMTSNNN